MREVAPRILQARDGQLRDVVGQQRPIREEDRRSRCSYRTQRIIEAKSDPAEQDVAHHPIHRAVIHQRIWLPTHSEGWRVGTGDHQRADTTHDDSRPRQRRQQQRQHAGERDIAQHSVDAALLQQPPQRVPLCRHRCDEYRRHVVPTGQESLHQSWRGCRRSM